MFRRASIAQLRPEKREEYLSLHNNPWPEVLEILSKHHHHNQSVYIVGDMLFQYFEYSGDNLEADIALMRQNPVMKEWWRRCDDCIEYSRDGQKSWEVIEEIFHNE